MTRPGGKAACVYADALLRRVLRDGRPMRPSAVAESAAAVAELAAFRAEAGVA